MPNYLDLFAGAGGLSEGFIQAGYTPIAHVELDEAACNTLRTRSAFHWLFENGKTDIYNNYLQGKITRKQFYELIPADILSRILQFEISSETIPEIFVKIKELLHGEKLDLIIGGPPCQAYSVVGRARSETNMKGDKRNYLYKLYAEFLKEFQPKYFVFENVTGILSAKDEDGTLHFENMQKLFAQYGYTTEYKVLSATDFGVLQNRKRVILIGKYGTEEKGFYPEMKIEEYEGVNVSELLNDLPSLHAGEGHYGPVKTLHYSGKYLYDVRIKEKDEECVTLHIARPQTSQDKEIYRLVALAWQQEKRFSYNELPERLKTHRNREAFLDRFKVVAPNRPYSQTVVAHVAKDGHYYIHPDVEQNRSLTPREVARLQTFPDNYFFESKKEAPGRTAAFKQIGNAVPVRLAFCIAESMKDLFD